MDGNSAQLSPSANVVGPQVVLNHAGCLKLKPDSCDDHAASIDVWKDGMAALAKLEHVNVKLSMPGYTCPVRAWPRALRVHH